MFFTKLKNDLLHKSLERYRKEITDSIKTEKQTFGQTSK